MVRDSQQSNKMKKKAEVGQDNSKTQTPPNFFKMDKTLRWSRIHIKKKTEKKAEVGHTIQILTP